MDGRPVRQRRARLGLRGRGGHQSVQQLFFILPLGQRPTDSRHLRPFQIITDRAAGQSAAPGNLPDCELVLMFES